MNIYKPTRNKKSDPILLLLLIIISLFVSFALSKQEAIIAPDDDSSSGDWDATYFLSFYSSHQKNRSFFPAVSKMHLLGGVGDLEIVAFWTAVIIAIKLFFEENHLPNIYPRAPPAIV